MATTRRIALGSAAVAALLVAGGTAWASSHREAPGITETPKVDGTDFYMFRSYEPGREGYVTLIANYQPLQGPYGGPNYFTMDPDAIYEIHIDNDGDAIEDITFQFDFDNDLANGGTGITLPIGGENVAIPLRQAGPITAQDPRGALNETRDLHGHDDQGRPPQQPCRTPDHRGEPEGHLHQADRLHRREDPARLRRLCEPLHLRREHPELRRPRPRLRGPARRGLRGQLGRDLRPREHRARSRARRTRTIRSTMYPRRSRAASSRTAPTTTSSGQHNITSLALEVPIACLTTRDDPVIGAWTTASLPQVEVRDPSPTYEATSTFGGAWVQQSRLSNPLVNEVVIGLPDKDRSTPPSPWRTVRSPPTSPTRRFPRCSTSCSRSRRRSAPTSRATTSWRRS